MLCHIHEIIVCMMTVRLLPAVDILMFNESPFYRLYVRTDRCLKEQGDFIFNRRVLSVFALENGVSVVVTVNFQILWRSLTALNLALGLGLHPGPLNFRVHSRIHRLFTPVMGGFLVVN
jgi:hypothetical protein